MKKTYPLLIAAFVLSTLIGAQSVSAQTTSASSSRWTKFYQQKQNQLEERKAKLASSTARVMEKINDREAKLASTTARIEEKIAERAAKIASSTAARKERLADKFKKGTENKIAQVVDQLSDVLNNLKNIDGRIISRIAKYKAENIDTSKAESLLPDAQTKLLAATDKVNTLQTSIQAALQAGVSTTTRAAIKTKIADVRNSVKAAHAAYILVIENLKPGENAPKSATSSVSTATSTN